MPRRKSIRPFFYKLYQGLILSSFRILNFKITVTGKENIPESGPCVVASNHMGHIDPYLLTTIFPEEMTFMTGLNTFLRFIARAFVGDCIPATGPAALAEASKRISAGKMVLFFPEGGRNETGSLEAKPGAAFVALKNKVKVLPVRIAGTENAFNVRKLRVKFGAEISVYIGEPISFDESYYSAPLWDSAKEATKVIMQKISLLN